MKKASLLVLSILTLSCVENYELEPLRLDTLIDMDKATQWAVFADGKTSIEISAKIDTDTEQAVTFVTTQGTFSGDGVGSDKKSIKVTSVNKIATTRLTADQVPNDSVVVTASITSGSLTYTNRRNVIFKTAKPTNIYLAVDKLELKPDKSSTVTFKVTVTRADDGSKVSSGVKLDVVPTTAADVKVLADLPGFIRTAADTETNPVSFTVKSLNTETGKMTITVSCTGDDGKPVTASRDVEFKN